MFKTRSKILARQAFHVCGGMAMVRNLRRGKLSILTYHKFPQDSECLSKQLEYLKTHYRIVSMDEAAQALGSGRALAKGLVVITVDDGHKRFFEHAFPVFKKFEAPAILYVTSDVLDCQSWFWFDRLEWAFLHSPTLAGGIPEGQSVGGVQQRLSTAAQAMEVAKRLSEDARLSFLRRMEDYLEIEVPETPPMEYAPLSWDEVRRMASEGVSFGCHTATHPILSRVTDENQLLNEIHGSKAKIEKEIGQPILHFAYPNGQPHDLSPEVVQLVKNAGFQTAVTTSTGQVSSGDDPFLLKRISCEPWFPEYQFRQTVAGFRV